ncbi:hypothetical protein QVD17_36340 [Tagetes erecta]|uniref:Uncharacterized protein n=1 Tax=Tagetes erecta TaxID=13708 RepID=A0AAD8JW70_TARER|nr:hypothetical protein QVD17_36340 [Tagetes erecta]
MYHVDFILSSCKGPRFYTAAEAESKGLPHFFHRIVPFSLWKTILNLFSSNYNYRLQRRKKLPAFYEVN